MRLSVHPLALGAVLASIFLPLNAHGASEIAYEVIDGKLAVFGYVLEPKYPIPGEDYEGRVLGFIHSPDRRWVVIQSGYRVKVDLWLYDADAKSKPVRIASEPGNHTRVNWHGNRIFEISWGGMGYSMSQLFRVEDPRDGKKIDDMIEYDERRDVYVAFFLDIPDGVGVEVGRAFARQDHEPERFELDLEFTYYSDARFTIESVEIGKTEVIVVHARKNGKKVRETLWPKVLQKE